MKKVDYISYNHGENGLFLQCLVCGKSWTILVGLRELGEVDYASAEAKWNAHKIKYTHTKHEITLYVRRPTMSELRGNK